MKKILSKKEIAIKVYKNLMGVLKKRRLYHLFRCSMGVDNPNTINYPRFMGRDKYYMPSHRYDNPFLMVRNYLEAVRILTDMVQIDDESLNKDSKVQMLIVNYINNLLHYCLECYISDFIELEEVGKNTFEITCKDIFGDGFVDESEKEIPDNELKMLQAQREFMMSEKGRGIRPNELMNHNSFIEFLKRKKLINVGLTPHTDDNWENAFLRGIRSLDGDEESMYTYDGIDFYGLHY